VGAFHLEWHVRNLAIWRFGATSAPKPFQGAKGRKVQALESEGSVREPNPSVLKGLPFGGQGDQLKYSVANEWMTSDKSIRNYFSARFEALPLWRQTERSSLHHPLGLVSRGRECRFAGSCSGAKRPDSGIEMQNQALGTCHFWKSTNRLGALLDWRARRCPGSIIDRSTFGAFTSGPNDCLPSVATPTCFKTRLRFLPGYSGRFAGRRRADRGVEVVCRVPRETDRSCSLFKLKL
jgi:hypothetical protein